MPARTLYKAPVLLAVLLLIVGMGLSSIAQDNLKAGINAYNQKNYKQAVEVLTQYLSTLPDNYDGNYYLGLAQGKLENWGAAVAALQRAYDKKDKPEALFELGMAYFNKGNLEQASTLAEKGLKTKVSGTDRANLNFLKASVLFQKRDLDQADVVLRYALAEFPKEATYHRLLGDINYERKVYALAISEYNQGIALNPSMANELHFRLGRAYFQNRQFTEALDQYKMAIAEDSTYAQAYLELGKIYYWSNKFSEALWAYEQFLKLKPESQEVYFHRGKMYFLSGQHEKAKEDLIKALLADPQNLETYEMLGETCQHLKQYADAEKYFADYERIVTESNPEFIWNKEHAKYWFNRGVANFYNPDTTVLSKAETAFLKAVELDSTNSEAYSYLGLMYYNRKQFDKAVENFHKKLAQDPTNYNTFINLGYTYLETKQLDSAAAAFQKSLEIKPDNLKALNQLAWVYLGEIKDYDKSGFYYERILELDSTDCDAKGYLGVSLLMQKQFSSSILYLQQAVICLPRHEQFNLWLAQAFHQSGQNDSAKKYYTKVLNLNPSNKDAKQGLEILEFQ
ncbi:MAG: tetratricopeptide repeat protein [candidate division Zixibacteria bacterium]|nr:tetratricopeptide repeat protein [candidate division Zixibacteria bacterium]